MHNCQNDDSKLTLGNLFPLRFRRFLKSVLWHKSCWAKGMNGIPAAPPSAVLFSVEKSTLAHLSTYFGLLSAPTLPVAWQC
jgi:hypothetical protein